MLYKHTKYKQVHIFSNLFAMHLLPQLYITVITISQTSFCNEFHFNDLVDYFLQTLVAYGGRVQSYPLRERNHPSHCLTPIPPLTVHCMIKYSEALFLAKSSITQIRLHSQGCYVKKRTFVHILWSFVIK